MCQRQCKWRKYGAECGMPGLRLGSERVVRPFYLVSGHQEFGLNEKTNATILLMAFNYDIAIFKSKLVA